MKEKAKGGQLRKPSNLQLDKSINKIKESIQVQESIKRRFTDGKEARMVVASSHDEFREHEELQRQLRSLGSFTSRENSPEKMTLARYMTRFMISPQSAKRRAWDFFTAIFVIYMCWMVPFTISFDWWEPGDNIVRFNTLLDVWFVFDIVGNFITGYYEYGFVVLNPRKIAIHYIKTWFFVDLLAAVPFTAFLKTDETISRKTLKLFKYIKLPKLLRISRLLRHFRQYQKYTSVTTVLLSFLFLLHCTSCVWTATINPCRDLFYPSCSLDNIINMYWSANRYGLDMLLGISDQPLYGTNSPFSASYHGEHIETRVLLVSNMFNVIGLLVVAVMFANVVFVVQSWRRAGNAFRKKMDLINYEMDYLRLPQELRSRIKLYYDYLWMNNKTLSDNLVLLSDKGMSDSLKDGIAQHMYKGLLKNVPLFKDADSVILSLICSSIRTIIFMPGDLVVRKGEHALHVFVIFRGTVEVLGRGDGNGHGRAIFLSTGQIFGEYAVIMNKLRSRSIRSCTVSELCVLDKSLFNELIVGFPSFSDKVKALMVQRHAMNLQDSDVSRAAFRAQSHSFMNEVNDSISGQHKEWTEKKEVKLAHKFLGTWKEKAQNRGLQVRINKNNKKMSNKVAPTSNTASTIKLSSIKEREPKDIEKSASVNSKSHEIKTNGTEATVLKLVSEELNLAMVCNMLKELQKSTGEIRTSVAEVSSRLSVLETSFKYQGRGGASTESTENALTRRLKERPCAIVTNAEGQPLTSGHLVQSEIGKFDDEGYSASSFSENSSDGDINTHDVNEEDSSA